MQGEIHLRKENPQGSEFIIVAFRNFFAEHKA